MFMMTFPFVLSTLLTGCGENLCTTEIIFSVNVQILDETGQPVADATPTYSVDGGEEQACEDDGTGGYNCGEDQSGEITVHVSLDGYEDEEASVTVEADECHVITESLEIQLVASQ